MATAQRNLNAIDWIAMILLIVGGLNWALVGLFEFDLVAAIFGDMSPLARAVYVAVGLSALWSLYTAMKLLRAEAYAPAKHVPYSGPERRRIDAPYTGRDRRMATY